MRISDANIQLWSSSEKTNSTVQQTKQTTTAIQDTERKVIGWQQDLNLTYNTRYLAKKQLQSSSISEITSTDQSSLTKITNEQAISEMLSGILSKDVSLFNTQFSFRNNLQNLGNEQLVTEVTNQLVTPSNTQNTNSALQPIEGQLTMHFETYELIQETEEMQVRAMGQVQLEDGRSIDFALELKMQRSFELEQNLKLNLSVRTLKDPLVINLSGSPVELTESSFQFDIEMMGCKIKYPLCVLVVAY